ncbi:GtrA family protein [Nesterenkonia sp. F]|uniref:GtrA family protein n=1 Tax=Nesterenkonia sp. F TaxID=795955 RepID=UPI000255D76D|nr:GtrA family protein [Nesterenkonia sp. F]
MIARLARRAVDLFLRLWREIAKFGVVGGTAFIIDSGVFLALLHGPMPDSQLKAKVLAGTVATLFSWVANRYWTFRHRRSAGKTRELMLFLVMNAIGLGIQTGCVGVSKYILGLDSVTQVFIAGNVIGLVLATSFRFVAYKLWVFTGEAADPADHHAHMLSDRELLTGDVPAVGEEAGGELDTAGDGAGDGDRRAEHPTDRPTGTRSAGETD